MYSFCILLLYSKRFYIFSKIFKMHVLHPASCKNSTVSHPLPVSHVCRVIVGAPRANSTYSSSIRSPGAVYKCRVHSNPDRRCTEMDLGRGWSLLPAAAEHNIYIYLCATNASPWWLVQPHTTFTVLMWVQHRGTSLSKWKKLYLMASLQRFHTQSLHKLPQASVLFYQNNAALFFSSHCCSCSFSHSTCYMVLHVCIHIYGAMHRKWWVGGGFCV